MLNLRKHRISRLEEFSDAVFGFALTLLVITADVPRNYSQLVNLFQGVPAFACCFALLLWIWHEHDSFFERYPLRDGPTTVLNGMLLFSVLLYIYPLKFMFDAFMHQVFRLQTNPPIVPMSLPELARASMLYGFGFFILMTLFALMYVHAHRRRVELGMTELAAFDARAQAGAHLVSAGVGLFAMLFALLAPPRLAFLSPSSFVLMGPGHWAYANWIQKRRRALETRVTADSAVQLT